MFRRISLLSIFYLAMAQSFAGGLLDGYDATTPSYHMTCWTGETGLKKYEIIGSDIVVDNTEKIPVLERKDKVFAGKANVIFFGEIVLIVDYKKRLVTQKVLGLTEVFNCY